MISIRGGWRRAAGLTAVAAVIAAGAGVTVAQAGADGAPPAAQRGLDPTCVLGPAPPTAAEATASPWLEGLIARSDALNREYRLGRYAPGGACADVPDWFRALVLRSDGLNRIHRLGPYAGG